MDLDVWMKVAKAPIYRHFQKSPQKAFRQVELHRLYDANRDAWRLKHVPVADFMRLLPEYSKFSRLEFPFERRKQVCYVWGDAPLLPSLMTLDPHGYFSHYTALELHQLAETPSDTIYLNVEQASRSRDDHGDELEQSRIDAAFQRRPRMSKRVTPTHGRQVCLLNGKQTGRLGVVAAPFPHVAPDSPQLRVTNIERTLIDIVVRPAYSGGPQHVLTAYALAKERTSVHTLVTMLRELDYRYPYHQSVGFCLERAGHSAKALKPLLDIPMVYDFYLAHAMGPTAFIPRWRLHVPAGLA